MKAFSRMNGLVAPMDQTNVDTDAIIPKQFLTSIKRSGLGPHLFDGLRYLDHGQLGQDCTRRPLNKDFPLNFPRYQGASILLARDNFGCGSSREHAPWALEDYGFRSIIAPGFADIFFNNCFKNGLLPIVLGSEIVEGLFADLFETEGFSLTIDLTEQRIIRSDGSTIEFEVDSFRKNCLLNGLDDIGVSMQETDTIRSFELGWKQQAPWLFDVLSKGDRH